MTRMMNWLTTLHQLQQQQVPAVMVTIVSTIGSTPREVGAKLIVTQAQLFGTIGGGNLEHQATAIAREQLRVSQPQPIRHFPLGAGLGQCCGGLVNLLFEPIFESTHWIAAAQALQLAGKKWIRAVTADAQQHCFLLPDSGLKIPALLKSFADGMLAEPTASPQWQNGYYLETIKQPDLDLLLFGAGHVGQAIVKIIAEMPISIQWIDNRDEQFPVDIADNVEVICTDTPESEVDAAGAGSFYLVMTHDHGLDQRLAEHILKRDDFAYFGLIGSKTKRRMFEKRMARRGMSPARFDNMTCPIGIDGIRSKQPAVIAISVVAQLMKTYDQRTNNRIDHPFQQAALPGCAI